MQVSDSKTTGTEKTEWEKLPELDLAKNQTSSENQYSSVCDIWKDNVHRLVTKIEFQTPIYLQAFSNVHTEFLHCVDNLFGTCYIWQKQYFDRLGIDQKIINAYGNLCESSITNALEFLDLYANYKKFQTDMAIEAMKIGNNYLHWWIDIYGKAVSFWSSNSNHPKP